jgi:glycosyltransferase involved in cell wall biosynthesis
MDLSAYAWLARLGLALAKKLSWAADEFITNSYAGQRVHQDYGYAQRPWSVITNGVDTTVFHPCLTPKALNNRRIICVARWDPMKDHATLLAAMQQVWVHCPDVILTLVGPGMVPENQALQAIIPKDRPVELLGSQQNMAEILHTADIAVLASKTEGLPNVLLEAMACAVPCAATAVGDVAHLLADGGGVIVPPQNPVQLAHAILQLLALPAVDRQAMGQQGRHTIEQRYSLEKMLQSYLQIWLR